MDKRRGKNEAQRLPPSLYSWNCYESVTAHSSDFPREGGGEEETHRNAIQQTRTVRRPPEGYGGTSLVYYCVCNSFTSTPLPQKLGMHLPDKSSSIFVQEIDAVDALLSLTVTEKWSLTDPDVCQKVREPYETLKKGGTFLFSPTSSPITTQGLYIKYNCLTDGSCLFLASSYI